MTTDQFPSDGNGSLKDLDLVAIRNIVKESVTEAISQLSRSNSIINTNGTIETNNEHRHYIEHLLQQKYSSLYKQSISDPRPGAATQSKSYNLGLVRGATQRIKGQPVLMSPDGRHIHMSIYCDICNEQILGARYKCVVCHDYDLCSNCKTTSSHPDDHPLLILNRPLWDKSRITIESEIYQQPDLTNNVLKETVNIWDYMLPIFRSDKPQEKKEFYLKPRSKACQFLRQYHNFRQPIRSIDARHPKGIPLESLIKDKHLQGTNVKRGFFSKDYGCGMAYVCNLTANPPPCSREYTSTINGIDSGRICYHRFSIKNETTKTWRIISLQMRRVFQTYHTIIKNTYIVDWSITRLVKPGDCVEVEIVYELDNVDSVFSSKNSFQQDWLLKNGNTYLADIKCVMNFERPMSKRFCPDTQNGSTDPVPSTSSSQSIDESAPSMTDDKNEETLNQFMMKTRSELYDIDSTFKRRFRNFKPPGTTPTSTPAGAMSPKSLDLVANALDITPLEQSKVEESFELEQSAAVQNVEELLIRDTIDANPVERSDKCSNGPTTALTESTSTDPNATNSIENSETKSESFFFLQPDEAKTSVETKKKISDRIVGSNASTRSKADVVATIRRSLDALNLSKESSDSSSMEDLSSDFVVVKLPSCFDLDVPFDVDKSVDKDRNAPSPSILDAIPWPKYDGSFIGPDRWTAGNSSSEVKPDSLACEQGDLSSDCHAGTSTIDQPLNLSTATELSKPSSDSADDIDGKLILPSPIRSQPCPNAPLYPNLESFKIEGSNQEPPQLPPKHGKKISSLHSFILTQGSDNESESSYNLDDLCVSGDEDSSGKVWLKVEKPENNTVQTRQPTNAVGSNELPHDLRPLIRPDSPNSPEASPMMANLSILSEMGFVDREANGSLLLKHEQDLDKVINELLGESL